MKYISDSFTDLYDQLKANEYMDEEYLDEYLEKAHYGQTCEIACVRFGKSVKPGEDQIWISP